MFNNLLLFKPKLFIIKFIFLTFLLNFSSLIFANDNIISAAKNLIFSTNLEAKSRRQGTNYEYIYHADFDNDGRIDIYKFNNKKGIHIIKFEKSGGINQTWTSNSRYGIGYLSYIGDFNNDSYVDIYLFRNTDGTHAVWLNNGKGGFNKNKYDWESKARYGIKYIAKIGDLNNDGCMDICLYRYSDSTYGIWINNGNGTFPDRYTYEGKW